MTERPLVLLDVDGVLNPARRATPRLRRYECVLSGQAYTVLLNALHGAKLTELARDTGAELAWATTWEHHANEHIAPRLGLPDLPVIEVNGDPGSRAGEHFKTRHVAEYVTGRPFVWFDDSLGPCDWQYLKDHPAVGDFLLVEVDPRTGLTDAHLARARDWLSGRRDAGLRPLLPGSGALTAEAGPGPLPS
ncbi:hypothetical protein Sme01_50090 [Sphaerisporangium melleum]|uniref:Secreted protein n=1 Tax=Sphaerisporangium melleum TaxID=321316 RepID=A0A917VK49_9ACTN|nr:HAD domain-containing protein [Sphaerisporangium melleum]GGK89741.1 hypothetical protein GCM10007964_35500 [Sphaerisporangium melleum]GII72533.1 hypothetical protein Sme01_50090 [Sphaerisporangium melleum]